MEWGLGKGGGALIASHVGILLLFLHKQIIGMKWKMLAFWG